MAETHDLPVLPRVIININAMLSDENASIGDIARAIESEPVLAGRTLKLANSAMFGGGRQSITSVAMSVGRLGLTRVREIIYSLELPNLFAGTDMLDHMQLWRHSLSVAYVARLITQKMGMNPAEQESAYLAGLMHDMGVLVFICLAPEHYKHFLEQVRGIPDADRKKQTLDTLEQIVFGIDHAELGARFIHQRWRVSEPVARGVKDHHYPLPNTNRDLRLGYVLYIANAIMITTGLTNGINQAEVKLTDNMLRNLSLAPNVAKQILHEARESVKHSEMLLAY